MAKKATDEAEFMEHLDVARAWIRRTEVDDDGFPSERIPYHDTSDLEDDALAVVRVDQAKYDPKAHMRLRRGIAELLKLGRDLPPALHSWLVHYLLGERPPPGLPRGAPSMPHRSQLVHDLVEMLIRRGLKRFRSPSPAKEPILIVKREYWLSACDVAAAALNERGWTPSTPETVKNLHTKEAKSIADEEARSAAADAARNLASEAEPAAADASGAPDEGEPTRNRP